MTLTFTEKERLSMGTTALDSFYIILGVWVPMRYSNTLQL
jgi:hypothetical protein